MVRTPDLDVKVCTQLSTVQLSDKLLRMGILASLFFYQQQRFSQSVCTGYLYILYVQGGPLGEALEHVQPLQLNRPRLRVMLPLTQRPCVMFLPKG